MTLSRFAVAISALFLLSACATSPSATASAESKEPTAEASPAVASFASYIQGDWTCVKPMYTSTELKFPAFAMGSMYSSEISIGDGTWSASWGEDPDDKAEGTWEINGREISLTSPLGTQIVGNLPETPDQALEPMRLKIADTDNNVTLQVTGERAAALADMGDKYATECTKF